MVIACLDTLFNVPVSITVILDNIFQGEDSSLNFPYISWKNVHNGAGGLYPGLSLSSILQVSVSEWSTTKWDMFTMKWNQWVYVLHAVIFFGVFGTTPEMRRYYKTAFWFLPERFGYKRQRVSEVDTVSDVAFNSNPGQPVGIRPAANRRRGLLSFLETTIDMGTARSGTVTEGRDLESQVTSTSSHRAVTFVEGDENHTHTAD